MGPEDENLPSATRSGRSLATSASAKLAASDVDRCLARLATAYGDDRRIADADGRALLRREMLEALGHFEPHVVNAALGKVIRQCKFWPSIAEIVAACEPYDMRTAEEKYGRRHRTYEAPKGLRPIGNIKVGFCRDGRTVEQEVAHRGALIARMKQAYAPAFDYVPDEEHKPAPASQEPWVSDQLRAHAQKRGYWTGEP